MRENVVVQIPREDLSRRYASLSDAELFSIDRNDLTSVALECYDREMARRHVPEQTEPADAAPEIDTQGEVPPDWLESAATACSFQVGSGQRYAEDAARAASSPTTKTVALISAPSWFRPRLA
jgi:hypothetical protein